MIANLLRIQTPDIRVFMVAGLAAMTFAIMREFAVVTVLPMLLLVPFLSPFRVSPFELTVPITASQVFTARLVTSLLAMMTPIAVWIVAWLVRDPATFSPDIVVASAGGAALLALAPLAIRPRDAVPPRPKQLFLLVVSVVAVEAVLWYFAPVALTAAVSVALFAVILVRTWRALPPSYVIDPAVHTAT